METADANIVLDVSANNRAQSLERKRKMQNKLKTKYTCCMKDLLQAKL